MRKFSLLIFLFSINTAFAQRPVDILHYTFNIRLNDNNDTIYGKAIITGVIKDRSKDIDLDLTGLNKKGNGMIASVYGTDKSNSLSYSQSGDKLLIRWDIALSDTVTFVVDYKGIPADGLIISKNKYGHRTFFGDNWPDRAHNWLPCVDDPADKATVDFVITAPQHYQVVANGVLVEESNLENGTKLTHWKEDVPLPTKVMVIGAADFAVEYTGSVNCVPVSSWVFPEKKAEGFEDYNQAKDILAWYMNYIGPYGYKKLANVQSKTVFGGMENASAIFYFENSVTGFHRDEDLMAHEIAHQWFGNMATEKSFRHLWLSEGFATYMTDIYLESRYGTDSMNNRLKEERQQVIAFSKHNNHPVVDSLSPYMELLNANSYQKGGWVLHMLRRQLGDSVFHKAIRTYYAAYAGKNADTRDLERIFEEVSHTNLSSFFDQWLYTPGLPRLNIAWRYDETTHKIEVTVSQLQNIPFRFPLELAIKTEEGKTGIKKLAISKQTETFEWPVSRAPAEVKADPNVSLLFEGLTPVKK
ncbi:MAG: M1 family peptidase [Bacteroidetes bacterium]|nr:M1 family peptidase [Bacteroidota bacterium]